MNLLNYEEWVRWKLGDKICDEYMIPYNEKLWGVEPKEMDIDWLHKIPNVDVKEVLLYSLQRRQDVNKFPAHINFYYPKKNGFESIVTAIASSIMDKIIFNEKVVSLRKDDDLWIVNNEFRARKVINTSPWNGLKDALNPPAELENAFSKIKYNRIVVSLFEKDYEVDWHWRYIPNLNKSYHREFYIHIFAEDSRKDSLYVETGLKRYKENSLTIDGRKSRADFVTDAAYPIPVIGHQKAIKDILDYYKPLGLFGVGRWGQHEYQNADVSMWEALRFVEDNSEK